ncbi:hypothetical protein G5I_05178 [Acromyrmex echinatior]|uniref:Uncharacterized protein n=1 Tax=Acromyrmex echinatior TaxID=103372 RepID=F4WHL5_ACREC|nr:hypothetical protein G5I_05178 [Acromyrmex echinatior]
MGNKGVDRIVGESRRVDGGRGRRVDEGKRGISARPFYVKDSYVERSVESVNIKIYGTFVRIDAGNSTRKRISSVGDAMNARFRDQFRTAIEVREIEKEKKDTKKGKTERRGKETRRMSGQYLGVLIVTSIFDSSHNSFFSFPTPPPPPPPSSSTLSLSVLLFFSCHGLRGHASTGFQSIDRSCVLRTRQGRLFASANRGQIDRLAV